MPVKPGYLILAGAGAIFLWSGLQGKSATGVARALIGGQDPGSAAVANAIVATPAGTGFGSLNSSNPGSNTGSPTGGPTSGGGSPAANQALARMIAIATGHPDWTVGQQWNDWVALWNGESGWDATAYNPGTHTTNPDDSHAFGIPQALPASKMASAGPDWRTNPATQIRWGIGYIDSTYGSPSAAYSKWLSRSPHWY